MNERIRQLWDQAKTSGVHPQFGEYDKYSAEKFARLIVEECINIVKPTQHHEAFAQGYLGDIDGLELLDGKVKQIKQHFGVEE